jgi:hypothetical protein
MVLDLRLKMKIGCRDDNLSCFKELTLTKHAEIRQKLPAVKFSPLTQLPISASKNTTAPPRFAGLMKKITFVRYKIKKHSVKILVYSTGRRERAHNASYDPERYPDEKRP